jgi:hypothetical protein
MVGETPVHPHVPVQVPSAAAVAILTVFIGMGLLTDGTASSWIFGAWVIAGAVSAATLVRPVGLWVVVPAPPMALLIVVIGRAAWRRQPMWGSTKELVAALAPPYLQGFPWLAAAIGAGIAITAIRLIVRSRA